MGSLDDMESNFFQEVAVAILNSLKKLLLPILQIFILIGTLVYSTLSELLTGKERGQRDKINSNQPSEEFKDLVFNMMAYDPHHRPSL